ncbi:hypothetical protein OUZ56_033321 [Daphnia magna]|uniref:CCHC-type domain-containing protein n=1 Tax=Daphnia magna TaxID=35525 RepID=A0ABQ9ZXL0_9CRUS|nr:hypothetical protein OUZ56_033321 [Daphnia magna]
MNDDVITGGSRIPRTPIQPSVPQINVPLPSEPTVSRSLNFDKLHVEPQISPDTCPACTTPKPISEPASKPASSVVSTQPSRVSSQLSKLRSNGAYEAVARLDLVSRRKPRAKSPPKVSPKSSSVAKTVLGFFTRNSPNGKSTEPEPTTSIQQNQEQSTEDIPAQNEPASVPYPCDQEPEGERSGLSVDRSEDLGTANLVDSRHPSIEPLFTRNESNDGVDRTNDSAETSDVDPTGETTRTGEENNPIGSPSVRADIDLHITCETIPDISAESNSLHHGTARCDTTETRDNLSLVSEFWNFHQTPRRTLPTSNERSERVILPLGSAATDPSTVVPDRHPQLNLLPAGATPADSAGTANSGNQLVAEEIGQLPGSSQPEQRAAGRGDQTNTLPNQGPIATVPTIPYGGGRTSTTRGPTTSTPSRGEDRSTSTTGAIRRPPPYSLLPSSMFDPTPTHTDYTTQERRRRYSESRSSTSSISTQSHNSRQESLRAQETNPKNMAQCPSPSRAATARDLDDLQNNQHTFSRLQLLPSFSGSPLTRFDSWLESFEAIVDTSGWSGEKIVQMLRAKLTDRAFSVIQAILKDLPHDYDSVKEALLDQFHGDENVDLYLKKFNKAKRKPGEKIVDYALRLQEIFKRAYPVAHSEKSFAIILMQKFIEGLDSKLQTKVKYKDFKDFGELVTSTRRYASRLEALETDRERQEFIRSIDGTHGTNSAELTELKQMIVDQKEMMMKAVANVHHEDKPVVEKKTESEQIRDVLSELVQSVKKLHLNRKDVSYPSNTQYRKQVSFQPTLANQQDGNVRAPQQRFNNNNGNRQFVNSQNSSTNNSPPAPRPPNDFNNRPLQSSAICNFCGYRGHIQADCRRYQRQGLEQAQPPICYSCRDIGHRSNNCPKFRNNNRPNIPGSPQHQENQ